MSPIRLFVAAVSMFGCFAGGCAGKPEETGFLSTYKNLEPVSSTSLRYIAPNKELGKYNKFIVEPVTTVFYDKKAAEKLSEEDKNHLEQFMFDAIRKAVGEKYTLVSAPASDVARIRIAITNLKAASPALNVLPQTKLTGLGLGEASAEIEIVDSLNGKQIAAGIESQTGSRLSLSGLSKWGDAEAVMTDWCNRVVKRIDEEHAPK